MGARKKEASVENFIPPEKLLAEKSSDFIHHIPNILSGSRILLALYFPFVEVQYQWLVITIALATEFLDGYVARTFHCVTELGKTLDPVADKIFLLSLGVTWILTGAMSWLQLLLLSSREICFFLGGLYFVVRGYKANLKPTDVNQWGKLTTAMQYAFFFLFLMNGFTLNILLLLIAMTGVISAVQYFSAMHRRRM